MNAKPALSTAFQDEVANFYQREDPISSVPLRQIRARVSNPRSPWMERLEKRFNVLTSLRKGWDGYAGLPVSFTCAQFAANMIERLYIDSLPPPQLVPMSDGTLRLEWHMNKYDLEIAVLAPYEVFAYRLDLMSDQDEEIEVQTDFTQLFNWVSELAVKRVHNQLQVEG